MHNLIQESNSGRKSGSVAGNGGEPTSGPLPHQLAMIRTEDALKTCQDVQHIIDITSQHLDRLRWVRA